MNILFAIQATGNGHLSRAREIIPHLLNHGNLDVLVSGRQAEVQLPYLIKYKRPGIGYTFGKHGGIDFIDSIQHLKPFRFFYDISTFPVHQYDLIINDFEPVTAWACKLQKKPCIALSHQASFLSPFAPRPAKKNHISEMILRHFAPSSQQIGFHFKKYDTFIRTPVIRSEIRNLNPTNNGHVTVYLPAHADEVIIPHLKRVPDIEWHVFSKHAKMTCHEKNVQVFPVSQEKFLNSFASCDGLITAGGFESPAEAIFLKKKIMSVPMLNQYEQACNAEALKGAGVNVVKKIDETFSGRIKSWLHFGQVLHIDYPNETAELVEHIVSRYAQPGFSHPVYE